MDSLDIPHLQDQTTSNPSPSPIKRGAAGATGSENSIAIHAFRVTVRIIDRILIRLLAPLLVLEALPIAGDEPDAPLENNEIPPTYEPSPVELEDFAEQKRKRRRDRHEDSRGLLRYIPPVDRARIVTCGKAILRFHNSATGNDVLVLRKCGNYYCPWCPHTQHIRRTHYQAAKFQSLSPEQELRVINIVWSLPVPLQELVRHDPRGLKAWTKSVRCTIAHAYDYRGRQGVRIETAAWNELGAIRNHHAIGDKAEPWPKSQPHMDMLLAAYRRREDKLVELPEKWPELYEHTAHTYRKFLRAEFTPIANALGDSNLARFLRGDFDVDWHVSPADGTRIVHTDKAMHRIRYSCRPFFNLGQCRLEQDGDEEILAYDIHPDPDKNTHTHRVKPGPAFGQLESLREWMTGRKSRSHLGILAKRAYADAARLAGNEPIPEKVKRGLKLKAAWLEQQDGSFIPVADPREVA